MSKINLSTDEILAIAGQLETDNKALDSLLADGKKTIDDLIPGLWSGEAAEAVKAANDSFATKYHQTYYDVLDQYVKLLKTQIPDSYIATENYAKGLAANFE